MLKTERGTGDGDGIPDAGDVDGGPHALVEKTADKIWNLSADGAEHTHVHHRLLGYYQLEILDPGN